MEIIRELFEQQETLFYIYSKIFGASLFIFGILVQEIERRNELRFAKK